MNRKERHAFWLLAGYAIHRYLMANTTGRLDGAEKASRHMEISNIFVALTKTIDLDRVGVHHLDLRNKIHDHTQKLTSHMDAEIGFPVGDRFPDYDNLAQRFARRFVDLASEVLKQEYETPSRAERS